MKAPGSSVSQQVHLHLQAGAGLGGGTKAVMVAHRQAEHRSRKPPGGGGQEHPWPRPSSSVPVWFCPHPQPLGPKPQGHTHSHTPQVACWYPTLTAGATGTNSTHSPTGRPNSCFWKARWNPERIQGARHSALLGLKRLQICLFLEACKTIHLETPPVLVQQPRVSPSSPCRVEGRWADGKPCCWGPMAPYSGGCQGDSLQPSRVPRNRSPARRPVRRQEDRVPGQLNLQKTVGRSQIHRIRGFPHLGTVPKTCVSDTPSPSRLRPPRGPLHRGVCAPLPGSASSSLYLAPDQAQRVDSVNNQQMEKCIS